MGHKRLDVYLGCFFALLFLLLFLLIPSHSRSQDDDLSFVTSNDSVIVSEGGTGTFTVELSAQPESAVNATVGAVDGDGDISVQEGGSLLGPGRRLFDF
jgi:hypothetical protein